MPTQDEKKELELKYVLAARSVSNLVPEGILELREEPDFELQTEFGQIGIEVTELMRPAECHGQFDPVSVEQFHREVIRLAEYSYYRHIDALHCTIRVYFTNFKGKVDKNDLAESIAQAVRKNVGCANPIVNLPSTELPIGISSMSIWTEPETWRSGESGVFTLNQIVKQIERMIAQKEFNLPRYRKNLPNVPIWLFMYSGVAVSRGFEIPSSSVDLSNTFTFDKVLWYSALNGRVIEIPHRV